MTVSNPQNPSIAIVVVIVVVIARALLFFISANAAADGPSHIYMHMSSFGFSASPILHLTASIIVLSSRHQSGAFIFYLSFSVCNARFGIEELWQSLSSLIGLLRHNVGLVFLSSAGASIYPAAVPPHPRYPGSWVVVVVVFSDPSISPHASACHTSPSWVISYLPTQRWLSTAATHSISPCLVIHPFGDF